MALGILLAACGGAAEGNIVDAADPDDRLAAVDEVVDSIIDDLELDGAALVVLHDDERIERTYGDFTLDQPVRQASASKWIAAATIMTLVDDGLVDLDAPISDYVEANDPHGRFTLRELLTHSAGLPAAHPCTDDTGTSLEECAALVLVDGRLNAPGTVAYGSPGFQVAGSVAEAVTQSTWQELFDERLAEPLGLARTTWRSFNGALTDNPDLGAGLISSPADYARFLSMLLDDGVTDVGGTTVEVLSPDSVAELHRVAARVGDRAFAPGNQQFELTDDSITISSPGVLGTRPWLVPEHGLAAVLMIERVNADVVAEIPGGGPIHRAVHELFGVPTAKATIWRTSSPFVTLPEIVDR